MGIAGSPDGVLEAAETIASVGRAFAETADSVAAHGRAVTADWEGRASDAAGLAIEALSGRTRVGSTVLEGVAPVLRTYATALRAAQQDYDDAAGRAEAARTALGTAHTSAAAAESFSTIDLSGATDPAAVAAQAQARDDAATAATTANSALSGATADMAAAVTAASQANIDAAAQVNALTDQLTGMAGTTTATSLLGPMGTADDAGPLAPLWMTVPGAASEDSDSADDGEPADDDRPWWEDAWAWTEDHADTISTVAGTAALVTAFIPGVDVIATPLLTGVSIAAGGLAAHHAYAEGDTEEGNDQLAMAALGAVPGGRLLGNGAKVLKTADKAADAERALHAGEEAATTSVSGSKAGAAQFGTSTSNNYRETFFAAHPDSRSNVVVHHAVEQSVLKRYPGLVSPEQIHSLENLRGIPTGENSSLHLSQIRKSWNKFYKATPNPSQEDLLRKASEIDDLYGTQFTPPVR